ncbi:hypothetical protein PV703_10480 [Streptomyces sp. ME01-24h]|nr:hypothetical protein [Streptomyces sp. ME19-03-3]MDX3214061.1 hypothetical protein [Streptomyces sp. ME02-6991-2B]MDX3353729.1 hypothetical protein [Streptomyces sp. ME01-24h]
MTFLVSLAVLLAMIAVGAFLIRALNERHDQRIAAFRYGDLLPYRRRTVALPEESTSDFADSPAGTVRDERRGGSRRRLRSTGSTAVSVQEPARLLAAPLRVTVSDRPAAHTERTGPPPTALAEVRVIAASPEAARRVAETLRQHFAGTEQRSYPATPQGGTRLHLTVDTTQAPGAVESFQSGAGTLTGRPHEGEIPPRPTSNHADTDDAAESRKRADTARARRAGWPPATAWG